MLYRLLAQATTLNVATALKWQLAEHCLSVDGAEELAAVEAAFADSFGSDSPVVVRNEMPVCGGELSKRYVPGSEGADTKRCKMDEKQQELADR